MRLDCFRGRVIKSGEFRGHSRAEDVTRDAAEGGSQEKLNEFHTPARVRAAERDVLPPFILGGKRLLHMLT